MAQILTPWISNIPIHSCLTKKKYLWPVAALALLIINKIRLTSHQICKTSDTPIVGVSITGVWVEAINLSSTEITPRRNLCGGIWAGAACGDDWWTCWVT